MTRINVNPCDLIWPLRYAITSGIGLMRSAVGNWFHTSKTIPSNFSSFYNEKINEAHFNKASSKGGLHDIPYLL